MSVTALHTLYAVDVDPVIAGDSIFIDQVTDFAVSPNVQEALAGADGQVDPTYVATMGQAPRIGFSTSKLATVLAKVSAQFFIKGIKIDSDVDDDGLECFFQKLSEGGTREGASSHVKLTVNEGLLVPRGISAVQGGIATLGLETLITWDGVNNPIVIAGSQSLIGSPSVSELYTLGPVNINGSQIDGVQGWQFDPGIVSIVRGADGLPWPTYVGIMSRVPSLIIQTTDVTVLSTFGLAGAAQGASDSVAYLRKMAEGGTRVADATAEHISFTMDAGMITVGPITGSHGEILGAEIRYRPTWDKINDIVVVDTAAAIV